MIYLNCGFEDECETKDCLNCQKTHKIEIEISEAEASCIEDFGVIDIEQWLIDDPENLDLCQDIMKQLMFKVFEKLNQSGTTDDK